MRGLSRVYQVDIPYDKPRPILAMAFNQNCDVMVATVVAPLNICPAPSGMRSPSSTASRSSNGRGRSSNLMQAAVKRSGWSLRARRLARCVGAGASRPASSRRMPRRPHPRTRRRWP